MRSLDTIFAILCVVVILFIVPLAVVTKQAGESLEVCAEAGADQLASDIRADGKLDLLKVENFGQVLMNCGYSGDFKVTVYMYEDAVDGSTHRYVVTWEEILQVLEIGEDYLFPKNCYINVSVPDTVPDNMVLRLMFSRTGFEKPIILGSGT